MDERSHHFVGMDGEHHVVVTHPSPPLNPRQKKAVESELVQVELQAAQHVLAEERHHARR